MEDIRIDVKALTEEAGGTFLQEAIMSVDGSQKIVLTDQGKVFGYDAVSFDIGSLTAHTELPGVKEHAKRIKPNYHFPEMIEEMRNSTNPVIVGGGIAGTEMALSLQAYRRRHGQKGGVSLITSSDRLLAQQSNRVSNKIEEITEEAGINLYVNQQVKSIDKQAIWTNRNEAIPYDDVLWLTGPKAPDLFRVSNLPIDKDGYLQVESTLQVKDYPSIFGAGDCITLSNAPNLPKNGVFAIREAPILWENIRGFLTTGDGRHYKPQQRYLSIMSIGNYTGFLMYGDIVLKGKWAWKWKHHIDTTFIQSYQF